LIDDPSCFPLQQPDDSFIIVDSFAASFANPAANTSFESPSNFFWQPALQKKYDFPSCSLWCDSPGLTIIPQTGSVVVIVVVFIVHSFTVSVAPGDLPRHVLQVTCRKENGNGAVTTISPAETSEYRNCIHERMHQKLP